VPGNWLAYFEEAAAASLKRTRTVKVKLNKKKFPRQKRREERRRRKNHKSFTFKILLP
jgi:hypothetical protein